MNFSDTHTTGNDTYSSGLPPKHQYGENYSIASERTVVRTVNKVGLIASTLAVAMVSPWAICAPLISPTNLNISSAHEIGSVSFRSAANLASIAAKLVSFVSYPQNWDGYGAVIPSSKAVDDALTFLRQIPPHLSLPRPGLSGDGEIGLFWETKNLFIDVGFEGDDNYSYYAKNNLGKDFFGDAIDVKESIRIELLKLLPSA